MVISIYASSLVNMFIFIIHIFYYIFILYFSPLLTLRDISGSFRNTKFFAKNPYKTMPLNIWWDCAKKCNYSIIIRKIKFMKVQLKIEVTCIGVLKVYIAKVNWLAGQIPHLFHFFFGNLRTKFFFWNLHFRFIGTTALCVWGY